MILTCPDCATRYFVEDSKLGPDGRTVRCASCGTSWHARADEPLELTSSGEEGAVARDALSFKPDDPSSVSAPELPKMLRAKVQQRRRVKEAAAAGVVWAGMVSAFAAVLVAAYVFRVEVVKLYPRAAGAYAMARVPVNPTGLEFEKVKAEPAPGATGAVLVSGEIRNVESDATTPPPIRVALLDAHGKKLATKVVRLTGKPVAPGKAVAFAAVLPDPKSTGDDVAVEFALDLQPPAPDKPKSGRHPAATKHAAPPKAAPAPTLRPATAQREAPSGPAPKTPAEHGKASSSPTHTGAPAKAAPLLRPAHGLPARPVEARPLPSNDPYALDRRASEAVSAAPHG